MAHYVITIDGKVVDLGNANITLTWKSNLFTDLSKITGNHSYTINLPKSQTNRMIFGIPDMPGFNSAKVRKYLPATIEIDGILIADNARAVLTGVDSGSYSVALTWGLGVAIQKIADAGKTLRELIDNNEFIAWNSTSSLMNYSSKENYGFATADYGFGSIPDASSRSIFYHPCVSAKWILNKIATQHSASVSLPSSFDALLKKLYIPLVTKFDSELRAKNTFLERSIMNSINNGESVPSNCLNFNASGATGYGDASNRWYYETKIESDAIVTIDIKIGTSAANDFTPKLYFIKEYNGKREDVGEFIVHSKKTYDSANAYYIYSFKKEVTITSLEETSKLYVCVSPGIVGTITRSGSISIWHKVSELRYPWSYFPIMPNLPDIKQIDFIKMICAMYGYTINASGYGLSFVKIATVVNNAGSIYYDWSDRMISDTASISYTLNDFAQRNWIRWKESDEGISEDAAYIPVNNNTLTAEKDLIKFPLSNSKGSEIPCYSYNKDGELEYKACKSRIMLAYERPDGKVGLTFNGLNATDLISENYVEYGQLVGRPFVLKSSFRLTSWDLKNINIYKPVYLSHYGCFFAIISINNNNGVSEVELLKI